jgi:hypothetical protein
MTKWSCYFLIERLANATLDDARLFGDGYDFQLMIENKYILAEIKGIRNDKGSIRMTSNEYKKAQKYKNDYALVVVSNLEEIPKMTSIFDPLAEIVFKEFTQNQKQIYYQSAIDIWR